MRATTGRIFFTSRSFFDGNIFLKKFTLIFQSPWLKMNEYATRGNAQRQSESEQKSFVLPKRKIGRPERWPIGKRRSAAHGRPDALPLSGSNATAGETADGFSGSVICQPKLAGNDY
jgi:hypothetical protein